MNRFFHRRHKTSTSKPSTSKSSTSPTSTQSKLSNNMALTEAAVTAFVAGMKMEEVASSADIVLVDFFAVWCGPCRAIAPIVENLAQELTPTAEAEKAKNQESVAEEDKCTKPAIKFYKLDVDNFPEAAAQCGISAMPTFFIYKDGEVFKQIVGANAPAIQATLNEAIEVKYGNKAE